MLLLLLLLQPLFITFIIITLGTQGIPEVVMAQKIACWTQPFGVSLLRTE